MDEGITRTWILVADPAEARLFISYPGQAGWFELHAFRHGGRSTDAEFAAELAEYLDVHLGRSRYERLVLVAPPAFLRLLQQELTPPVARRVADTLKEDLVHLSPRELARHVELHH